MQGKLDTTPLNVSSQVMTIDSLYSTQWLFTPVGWPSETWSLDAHTEDCLAFLVYTLMLYLLSSCCFCQCNLLSQCLQASLLSFSIDIPIFQYFSDKGLHMMYVLNYPARVRKG